MNEANQYAQYLGPILAVLGGLLQWVRANPKVHDSWIVVIAFVLANAGYWLCYDYAHVPGWQLAVIQWVLAISGYTLTVIGGTAVAARYSYSPSNTIIPTAK